MVKYLKKVLVKKRICTKFFGIKLKPKHNKEMLQIIILEFSSSNKSLKMFIERAMIKLK